MLMEGKLWEVVVMLGIVRMLVVTQKEECRTDVGMSLEQGDGAEHWQLVCRAWET